MQSYVATFRIRTGWPYLPLLVMLALFGGCESRRRHLCLSRWLADRVVIIDEPLNA